ncbi:hypothetical protein TELCIR_10120 [Teladorsagia circumcincta]|uniref:Uncharacterized protein n=1 Tax=Teladorsagia circumcincta TaxID=45464 RepID=A0A2G9UF45_TELCI|nr:hypothetical protein TELCIR_10120 [Teladorsagia circumcincta]
MLPCPASMFTDSLVQMVLKEGKIHKVRVSPYPALADFTVNRGFGASTESHSPSFGCQAIEQLHSRKALFFP